MSLIDSQVNTVLDLLYQVYDTLSGRSLADNTIVIRTADHGEMGLAHGGLRQKSFNMYDESLTVPLIISNPILFKEAKTNRQLYSHVDMMPTLNGLLNLGNPLDYTFRGVDLSPVIKNPDGAAEVQDAILFTFDDFRSGYGNNVDPLPTANRVRCIREKKWKYGYYFYIAPPEVTDPQSYPMEYEMYDLENDHNELENLANPAHPRYNDPNIVSERNRLHAKLLALEEAKTGMVGVETPAVP